ncbi:MAG: EAL domain-containing protein [Catonella sp.]|uniref:EAL domain-containing protein n=1 Tax=Catonella sp. TaxID=2382125 RepID=UPI003FA0308D
MTKIFTDSGYGNLNTDDFEVKNLNYKSDKIGIIGFSLNGLRIINETKGRGYGDRFLKVIVDTIFKNLDGKIYLYKIEGVKFLALVDEKHINDTENIANKIKNLVTNLYFENNFVFPKSIKVGIYVGNKGNILQENLLDIFDKLMSKIKNNSFFENICVLCDDDIVYRSYLNNIESELHRCVHSQFENFKIVIQPIINNADQMVSAEILLRWKYNKKLISPEIFIPILERTGLIWQVGRFVFEEAAKISREIKSYRKNFTVNVNISYIQILDDEFINFIEETLKRYKLSGNELILELTENNYDEDKERVLDFARRCKSMGMLTAIDDFGTGYSSVSFLIRYHANEVKIDKSLVKESTKSEENKQFLKGIICSCRNFGMLVCTEGVENEEELEVVRSLGCDYVQGFYFFKPMELADFNNLLNQEYRINLEKVKWCKAVTPVKY